MILHNCYWPLFLAFAIACTGALGNNDGGGRKALMCYFGSWSTYRWSTGKFDVEDIDPFLCTHLVFGFAGLDQSSYTIKSLDPYNDLYDEWGRGAFQRFTSLKQRNPELKTLLAIGGWNEGSTKYSEMASTPERRALFIQSALDMVLEHNFDGLDLDWEYPGGRDDSPGFPVDKANFASLLLEMRPKFDQHGLLITAAVSAGRHTIDRAYDVLTMSKTLDFINVMTYDFHGWWANHSYTGHNSPLYARPEELSADSPGYQMNTDFAIQYWLSLGARRDQLLLGLGTYGRGFNLADPANNGFFAPATSGIDQGMYTGTAGFWGYNEFCEKMVSEASQWKIVRENSVVAPYALNGGKWFGYDDEQSVTIKTNYVKTENLGGAMVWSIDTDDFHGFCTGKKFGLIATIREVLFEGNFPTEPPTSSTSERSSTEGTSAATTSYSGDSHPICGTTPGLKPDPEDCTMYYQCYFGADSQLHTYHMRCGDGLYFDPERLICDWSDNVDCKVVAAQVKEVEKRFVCPGLGYFPDGVCTPHFYECAYDQFGYLVGYEFYCPVTTVFDQRYTICNYPYAVPECNGWTSSVRPPTTTSAGSLPPSDICKRVGLNGNPYEKCSQIYYDCQLSYEESSWKINQLYCDSDLYFDPGTLACTRPTNIEECTTRPTTSTTTTTTTTTTRTTTPSQNSICKHPGLNPDPHFPRDCSVYYACKPAPNYPDHWIITECRCDQGLAFDPDLEVCTWPSSLSDCDNQLLIQRQQSAKADECIARKKP